MIRVLSTPIRRDITPARGGFEIDYSAASWWSHVIPRPNRVVFIGAEVAVEFRVFGETRRWRARRDAPGPNPSPWTLWSRDPCVWTRLTGPEDFA